MFHPVSEEWVGASKVSTFTSFSTWTKPSCELLACRCTTSGVTWHGVTEGTKCTIGTLVLKVKLAHRNEIWVCVVYVLTRQFAFGTQTIQPMSTCTVLLLSFVGMLLVKRILPLLCLTIRVHQCIFKVKHKLRCVWWSGRARWHWKWKYAFCVVQHSHHACTCPIRG